MKPHEIQEKLGLTRIRDRNWYVQPACATTGDGLYEGLTWLTSNHKSWAHQPTNSTSIQKKERKKPCKEKQHICVISIQLKKWQYQESAAMKQQEKDSLKKFKYEWEKVSQLEQQTKMHHDAIAIFFIYVDKEMMMIKDDPHHGAEHWNSSKQEEDHKIVLTVHKSGISSWKIVMSSLKPPPCPKQRKNP
jgi:hypothetical protein